MKSFVSLAIFAALATAAPTGKTQVEKILAKSALSTYPAAALLGASIEGCSVDGAGGIYAANKTHYVSLTDAKFEKPLLIGKGGDVSHFASSRFTCSQGPLVGDATGNLLYKASTGLPLFTEDKMLQPNDFTVSADEKRIYLSGMNYTANSGDLWFYDVAKGKAVPVPLPTGPEKTFRMNGIELSPDDKRLYVTSAENNQDASRVVSAKVWKFDINADGLPCNPTVAIDLYDTLTKKNLDPTVASMDPDGMRMDSKGTLFMTLNAFQRVLMWDTAKTACTAKVIDLETVAFPTNLELGGKSGTDLVVIGRCKADNQASCVDTYAHSVPGRAFTNLKKAGCSTPTYY